ncbi:MAG: putative extracellular nuclease [Saliniramus fredricksonii]|uniref:Endonuclease/Exonuclease/phosphatase family protein n=1 Tax=Saliniramus fredricksonii TaxID=1653334 RepID=A0A0P7X481_9HYPH|nr:endonuclease/exonuclease/phosphatase family protein [Saliniramus fredricksonii]KPQ09469.1 MAG: putative extracellular nuclease [Saliniramus fredricksonii]SCC78564.1 Endonuclease/Exonuclease/phosphatase family protein [Saliniramus fredricksonii]
MKLRIATFNVENLVSRNVYGPRRRPQTAPALAMFDFADPAMRAQAQASMAMTLEDDDRQATALAIAETGADILALQEVENIGVLAPFMKHYVHAVSDIRYGHLRLLSGNDPRGIDCAFAARRGLVADEHAIVATSYAQASFASLGVYDPALAHFGIGPDDRVFNRDCLEIAIDLGDRDLALFICHLKSMGYAADGRDQTRILRRAEACAIRAIVQARFGNGWRDANWIVLGDLNDHRFTIGRGGAIEPTLPSGIDPLFEDFAVDVTAGLPEIERWTLYHRDREGPEGVPVEHHVQLDHILISPALAAANPDPQPQIVRRGLGYATPLDPTHPDRSIAWLSTRADRYPRIGWLRPQASDHCPVAVSLTIPQTRRGNQAGSVPGPG